MGYETESIRRELLREISRLGERVKELESALALAQQDINGLTALASELRHQRDVLASTADGSF